MNEHERKMADAAFETVIDRIKKEDYYIAFWMWNGITMASLVTDPRGTVARYLSEKMYEYSRTLGPLPEYTLE